MNVHFFTKLCIQTNSRVLISNMIKFSPNSSPKIPESRIFGPKFKFFYFCTKLCYKTNSRILISNMTISFLNLSPKIPKSNIFGPKFRHFRFFTKYWIFGLKFKDFYFFAKLCNKANSRIWNMTIVFSHTAPKYAN